MQVTAHHPSLWKRRGRRPKPDFGERLESHVPRCTFISLRKTPQQMLAVCLRGTVSDSGQVTEVPQAP